MNDYILCGGCSFTADQYDFPVWPALVGKHYNIRVNNVGVGGGANDSQFDKIIDVLIKKKNNKPKHLLYAMTEFYRFYAQFPEDENFRVFSSSNQMSYDQFVQFSMENGYPDPNQSAEDYNIRRYIIDLGLQIYFDTRLFIDYNFKLLIRLIDTCELLNIPITVGLAFAPHASGVTLPSPTSVDGKFSFDRYQGIRYAKYISEVRNFDLKDPYMVDRDNFNTEFLKNPYFKKIDQEPKYYSKIIGWPFIETFGGHVLTNWNWDEHDKHVISPTDGHPNKLGQEFMAEHFIKHIGSNL